MIGTPPPLPPMAERQWYGTRPSTVRTDAAGRVLTLVKENDKYVFVSCPEWGNGEPFWVQCEVWNRWEDAE